MSSEQSGRRSRRLFWSTWLVFSLTLCGYFYYAVNSVTAGDSSMAGIFLPGQSTDGHHQIEMACTSCHTEPFSGPDILQNACLQCHADELERVDDSHPISKFTDPRNAETLEKLDARLCITCHREHRKEVTNLMGVTLPENLCFHCHADIGKDRPSHQNMDSNTCANGGCHNYHDNKALYENFLLKHQDKPIHLKRQRLDERDLLAFLEISENYPVDDFPFEPVAFEQANAPQRFLISPTGHGNAFSTKHAEAGVNCSACHQESNENRELPRWINKPGHKICLTCHQDETQDFLMSKHGMRLEAGLSAMRPEMARLPMKPDSHGKELNCMSCHSAHQFNTQKAAVQSCLQCHNDSHSKNYLTSPHAKLWQQEQSGMLPTGSGVSCATCHLPRIWHEDEEEELERILVDHNQSNTLRPNDKMLRPVCLQCHGLGFSIDALADQDLLERNFHGRPAKHVESIDMAVEADRIHRLKRKEKNEDNEN